MTTPPSQGEIGIDRMCWLAGVSRAGYYRHWRAKAPGQEEMGLRDALQRLSLAHRGPGYRPLTAHLRRTGWCVNHKRVLRLMREDNLLCQRTRPFVPQTTDSSHGWRVVPNLARGMALTGLDQLWVADITYVRLAEEFAYLAILLDAFSRKVVGWALELHLQASLAIAALEMALAARRPASGSLVHHSDRGVQYACGDYTAILKTRGIQPSMSRV
jgi:putative transposase